MLGGVLGDSHKYLTVLGQVSLPYLLLAIFVYYLSVLIYALRWKLVLRGMGKDVPFLELVKSLLASIFMNNVTPMSRSGGEVLRIAWISMRGKVPAGLSAMSIVYERILEAVPVFILFLVGMFCFSSMPGFLFVLGLLGIALVWIRWEDFVRVSLRLFKASVSEEELAQILSLKRRRGLTLAGILLSSVIWILDVVRLKLITLALGLHIGVLALVIISIASLLLGLVALTPGGVGIIEGGLVGTLVHFGLPPAMAVSVTLLERLVSYVLSTVVGFVVLVTSGGMEIWRALKSP
ncbi:lysylphosphatidylglycerol synthase transmembrane domain-containing protein [Thermococcus zilligii]|uniref:lysylphosphatidylglycerol synthase transmembrane domain-containing protein n=1 Tax=Thermococcus zilligii TaxID=54076 RepID=UPI00029B1AFD|nr:flippase-like domain-containing protein [Thermococcus zilligii]